MYELINTSLPNGLLPGTHGFSTVAMTKGMPDALRARVEALCAYSHRTSANDRTYYAENPANWFHVVLPQGVHAIGRVAPSDFDYTGRTNRVGKIRIFDANEMPDVGGAEVAFVEHPWYIKQWIGEPCYLAADAATCERLRSMNKKRVHTAENWIALLGDKGGQFAQRFAWQLEKNLSSGGKTIWFKASAQWDASGDKLLGLFSDLIDLLPPQVRKTVTFSTYSAALPAGMTCHLRGVYDDDKSFLAASSMSAWVDCENGKIVHDELLPYDGAETGARSIAFGGSKQQISIGVRKDAVRHLPKIKLISTQQAKKGRDPFLVAMLVMCVAVVVGFAGVAIRMYRENAAKMRAHGAAQALELQKEKASLAEAERKAKEERARIEHEAAMQKAHEEAARKQIEEKKRKEDEDRKKREDEEQRKTEEEERNRLAEEAKHSEEVAVADAEAKRKKEEAITNGTTKVGALPLPQETKMRNAKKYQEQKIEVFYYADGVLINQSARFNAKKHPTNESISQWEIIIGAEKRKEYIGKLEQSPIVVWFYDDKKYFDWTHRKEASDENMKWFAHDESRNIRVMVFGEDERVFRWWKRDDEYDILITWRNDGACILRWRNPVLTKEDVYEFVKEQRIKRIEGEIERKKKEESSLREKVKEAESIEKEARDKMESLSELGDKLDKVEARLRSKPKPEEERVLKKQRNLMREKLKDNARGKAEDEYKKKQDARERAEKEANRVAVEIRTLERQKKTTVTKDDVKDMQFELKHPEMVKEDI